jgi:hypothetical protein
LNNPQLRSVDRFWNGFFGFEDIYCIFAAYKSMLPTFWRNEDIRIRTSIAEMEYKYLTADQRIPRILDDVWAQMYISGYQLREILEETPRLKTLEGVEKVRLATELESNLRKFGRPVHAIHVLPSSS